MGNAVIYRPAYDAEVEYLESTETQWIDTGVMITGDYEVAIRTTMQTTAYNMTYFCARNFYGYNHTVTLFKSSSNDLVVDYGSDQNRQVLSFSDYDNIHEFKFVANKFYIDDVLKDTKNTSTDFTAGSTVKIYASNNSNGDETIANIARGKLYHFYIKDASGNFAFDGIPVRIGSVGYLYDKVSKQLFANKGTGQFILGNDVSNAVIPQQRCVLYFGNQRSVGYERIYEEYEWLVGDADAYINTLNNYHPYEDSVSMLFRDNLYPNRESKHNKYNAEEQIWGACKNTNLVVRSYISGTSYNSTNKICNNVIDSRTTDSGVNWGEYATRSFINDNPEHSLYISSVDANTDKYYFIYNGDTKNNLSTRYTLPEIINQDVCVFYTEQVTNGYFNGSFKYFIHYRNGDEIIHLIPCKLLVSIPAILDGNGIARSAGECGMWDKVSNRFYGNVGSGSFTVSND